jgi:hypothetical protein
MLAGMLAGIAWTSAERPAAMSASTKRFWA